MATSPRISVIELQSVGSTNEHAKDLARKGYPEGTLVWAHAQTGGKGRQGNSWESLQGNLFMSLILRPQLNAALVGQLSFLSALALAEVLREVLPATADIGLKWPNDLLLNGRKAAGILLEAEANGVRPVNWLVIGIGVNIVDAPEGAASLLQLGVDNVTSKQLMEKLSERIVALYAIWRDKGFEPVREGWMRHAANIGNDINVRLPRETMAGKFLGIDKTGALELGLPDGSTKLIASGEVFI